MKQLREEVESNYIDTQNKLELKLDKTKLDELEKSLLEKLNDLVEAIFKKFADKGETKKALKLLER